MHTFFNLQCIAQNLIISYCLQTIKHRMHKIQKTNQKKQKLASNSTYTNVQNKANIILISKKDLTWSIFTNGIGYGG